MSNAFEDIQEFLTFKDQVSESIELKCRVGVPLDDVERDFLEEGSHEEHENRRAYDQYKQEVERLKEICIRKRYAKKHPPFTVAHILDPSIGDEDLFLDDEELILERKQNLAHWQYPELLSQPDHVLLDPPRTPYAALLEAIKLPSQTPADRDRLSVAKKEYGIELILGDYDGSSKWDFVTRWLLHQLRSSPLEALLLRNISDVALEAQGLRVMNRHQWQTDVLFFWWRDGAVKPDDMTAGSESAEAFRTVEQTELMCRVAIDEAPLWEPHDEWEHQHETLSNS